MATEFRIAFYVDGKIDYIFFFQFRHFAMTGKSFFDLHYMNQFPRLAWYVAVLNRFFFIRKRKVTLTIFFFYWKDSLASSPAIRRDERELFIYVYALCTTYKIVNS